MLDPPTMPLGDLDYMLRTKPYELYAHRYGNPLGPEDAFFLKEIIIKGDVARAEVYLRCGATPDPKTVHWTYQKSMKNDWFPMLWAAMSDKVEMVELLLQYGADVNATGGILMKLRFKEFSPMFDCRRAHTALRAAVEQQNVGIVQRLLSAGACPESYQHHYGSAESRESRNAAIFCDMPVLYDAVKHGNLKISELLLKKGAKANLPKSYKLKYSYLTEAVRLESPQMVTLLLQHGADANFQVPLLGRTPLILAARATRNAFQMARQLIRHGANVSTREKQDALAIAALKKDLALVVLLLQSGAAGEAVDLAPLLTAVTVDTRNQASVDIVNLMIDWGAPVNGCDPSGVEPLFAAVDHRNTGIVETLLKRGAKANIVHGDMTPLKRAMRLHDSKIAKLLMDYGASATARVFAPSVITVEHEYKLAFSSARELLSVRAPRCWEIECMHTLSCVGLCITWALCHHRGRNSFCEWELVAAEQGTCTTTGITYQPVRRQPMAGSVVIACGKTACSPESSSRASVDEGSIVADWRSDEFKLSTADLQNGTLAMTQGSQRCLRSCELRFKVKAECGLLGDSKVVGEAWLPLSLLEVCASPGSTADFLVQLDLEKNRTGTLAFAITFPPS